MGSSGGTSGGGATGPNQLYPVTTGEEVVPRSIEQTQTGPTSGSLILSYWTARKTESITKILTSTYGAAAGTTLARLGIYSTNGVTATLIASTANDTTLWGSAFTQYNKSLTAPFAKVANTRYAFGLLIIGTTMPALGAGLTDFWYMATAPRMQGELAAQSDLPATITESALDVGGRMFQAILTP